MPNPLKDITLRQHARKKIANHCEGKRQRCRRRQWVPFTTTCPHHLQPLLTVSFRLESQQAALAGQAQSRRRDVATPWNNEAQLPTTRRQVCLRPIQQHTERRDLKVPQQISSLPRLRSQPIPKCGRPTTRPQPRPHRITAPTRRRRDRRLSRSSSSNANTTILPPIAQLWRNKPTIRQ